MGAAGDHVANILLGRPRASPGSSRDGGRHCYSFVLHDRVLRRYFISIRPLRLASISGRAGAGKLMVAAGRNRGDCANI